MKKFIAVVILAAALLGAVLLLINNKAKAARQIAQNVVLTPTVSVVPVSRKQVSDNLSLTGTVSANRDVMVISETVGRVLEVKADVGDSVKAGTELVHVDDELKLAGYQAAEVNYQKAKKDLDRFEALFKTKTVTETEIEGVRLAFKAAEAQYLVSKRQLSDTRITTPISGVVASRMVEKGTMISPGDSVANIIDISKLKVTVRVAEKDVFRLKAGDAVTIGTDIYPGTVFPGRIKTISSKADDGHTYQVEIAMDNSEKDPLKAGMFARVTFPVRESGDRMVIPREALLGSRRVPQVYVVQNGVAQVRDIVIGADRDTLIEVLRGLSDGELVVIGGQNSLTDGTAVQIAQD